MLHNSQCFYLGILFDVHKRIHTKIIKTTNERIYFETSHSVFKAQCKKLNIKIYSLEKLSPQLLSHLFSQLNGKEE